MPIEHASGRRGDRGEHPSAAVALVETLRRLGVEVVFGMDAPAAVQAELPRHDIRSITARDERSAAFMADGYAKVSGRPGVVGVGGVGATNTVQAVIESWLSSTPVVLLLEEGSGATRHRNELQDLDRRPIFASITKWAGEFERPERVAHLTEQAFRIATSGRPGPVYLGCPWDVVTADTGPVPAVPTKPATFPSGRSAPDPERIVEVAALLRAAARPAIIAGGGALAARASDALARLAHGLGSPVATTPAGKGAFDEFDPLSAGVVGSYTSGEGGRGRIAHEIVHAADLVLLVGTSTGSGATAGWTVPGPSQAIVHLDVDPVEIGRNYPASIPLVGDARLGLEALGVAIGPDGHRPPWRDVPGARDVPTSTAEKRPAIHPAAIYAEIQSGLTDETLVVADAGYCAAWALDRLRFRRPGRRILVPGAYGTLGYGLPAAIGAKIATPTSPVVCVTGDGGIGFAMAELETAARYGVAITVVVLNNAGLAWSRSYDRHFYGYEGETRFTDVDHAAVARALGCDGVRVTDEDELAAEFGRALGSPHPTVIDAIVDPEARPPVDTFEAHRSSGEAAGAGIPIRRTG